MHLVEVLIVVLALVKVIQVRSLYIRSKPTKEALSFNNETPPSLIPSLNPDAFKETISQNSKPIQSELPLPEVSYELPSEPQNSNEASGITNTNKPTLSNYIDDFFACSDSEKRS